VACAKYVQQCKVAAVQIQAAARKLAVKNMQDKNHNLPPIHSISRISSSDGLKRQSKNKSLMGVVCSKVSDFACSSACD
jgi:methylase of polypeptide subunit release factors